MACNIWGGAPAYLGYVQNLINDWNSSMFGIYYFAGESTESGCDSAAYQELAIIAFGQFSRDTGPEGGSSTTYLLGCCKGAGQSCSDVTPCIPNTCAAWAATSPTFVQLQASYEELTNLVTPPKDKKKVAAIKSKRLNRNRDPLPETDSKLTSSFCTNPKRALKSVITTADPTQPQSFMNLYLLGNSPCAEQFPAAVKSFLETQVVQAFQGDTSGIQSILALLDNDPICFNNDMTLYSSIKNSLEHPSSIATYSDFITLYKELEKLAE